MGSNKSAISATGKYSDCWNTKNSYNFKQLIDFSNATTWKIIKQTNANIFKYLGQCKSGNGTRGSVVKFISTGR